MYRHVFVYYIFLVTGVQFCSDSVDKYVQTETTPVKEVSVQVNLPPLTAEDLEGDDQKTRFYTGFVNFGTLMLIFNNGMERTPSRSNHTLKTKPDTNLGPNERCG